MKSLVRILRRVPLALAAICALVTFGSVASAAAQTGYEVTYVARQCTSYDQINANRARNDIQESLKDLGPDTQYTSSGFLVNPDAESQPPQDMCMPIVGCSSRLAPDTRPGP